MKKYLILFFVAAAAAFQSCDNNDDLWNEIDDLKGRVQALETQVDALNGNIEAMQALYKGGATISKVETVDGNYILTLTDGTQLTLSQGSEATAVVPVVSIDDNGNWQYSIDGGKTFISLNVNAVAEDGVTPQFRVDEATGLWQVNTTGEENGWTNVKDSTGKEVSAVGGEVTDKFFDSVRVDGDTLYIKLLGSDVELQVPIVADVLCEIVPLDEGIQMFDSGVERAFDVKMKGIDYAIVTAPEGWKARLTDPVDNVAKLYVTAPGKLASAGTTTRATANSSQDVAILATFGKYSCISKIQVQSTGVEAEDPTISVTNSTTVLPTDVTLTFDVQYANADGWKYICQKSDVAAPDAAKIFAEGTTVLDTSVTVEGLEAETEYTIYVVAYMGDLTSEVASATNTTVAEPVDENDYYKAGVEINGVRYDQNSEGARLLEVASDATEDMIVSAQSTATVSFIGDDNSSDYDFVMAPSSSVGVPADNIYIGRYADEKPIVTFGRYLALRNPGGIVAFKNLVLNFENVTDNYMFNFSNPGGIGTLIFEDCEIIYSKQSLITGYNGTGTIGNIIFRNCKIRYTGTSAAYVLNLSNPGSLDLSNLTSIVVENNIIYTTNASTLNCAFMSANNLDLSNMALTVENNTVVDMRGSGTSVNTSALFVLSKFGSISCKNNIFYSTQTSGYPSVFSLTNNYGDSWPAIDMERTSNVAYGSAAWKMFSEISSAYHPSAYSVVTIPQAESNPLSTCEPADGKFVVSSEYTGYGSTLE